MICPACRRKFPEDTGGLFCPFCGWKPAEPPVIATATQPDSPSKLARWLIFWVAFLGTPFFSLLLASASPGIGLELFQLGAGVAGFSLAWAIGGSAPRIVISGIVFSMLVVAVYFGIAFVGCIALLSHR